MNIAELREKCKSREAYTAVLIIVVGFASFGLGRLSTIEGAREPIRIEYPKGAQTTEAAATAAVAAATLAPATATTETGEMVVASKSGTKYHYPWCAGASQIAEKNKITFASPEAARKAGYTPASNCKGLK